MHYIKSLLLVCFLFILSGSCLELKASHAMGADLSYECLGSNQFRITLKFYRDCNGVEAPGFIDLEENSSCLGVGGFVSLGLEAGYPQIVTPICPSEPDACNGNGTFGIEEYIYSGVVTLPFEGACPIASFGYSLCCRNAAITTLSGASSQSMYVETVIDRNNAPCNSSPEFANIPTPYTCVGEQVSFNHGAIDAENDDLVFSLVNCQQSNGGNVAYAGGFDSGGSGANDPLTTASGVTIDPNTGTITFVPVAQQVGVICVLVEEYRNGIKIGETVRDMQFNIINCNNSLPLASGIDGTASSSGATGSYYMQACEGEYICFDIATYDGNGDIMNMSWNSGIPDGSYSTSNQNTTSPSGNFCWSTSSASIGSNFFTVTLVDEACPLEGTNTFSYEIEVFPNPNPPINVSPDNASICPGETVNLTSNANSANIATLNWAPPTNVSSSTSQNTTVFPTESTIYSLTTVYNDGCSETDYAEITVIPNPPLSLNSTYVVTCPGQTVSLIAIAAIPTGDLQSFNWIENPGGSNALLGSGIVSGNTSTLDVSPTLSTEYEVTVINTAGCSNTLNVLVDVTSPPPLDACNLIYVDDVNSITQGTPTDPTGLLNALERSLCNNTVIKMATGTYDIDNPIIIPSYITIEGGFDPTSNWEKTSLQGATTINRTIANIEDELGTSPRLVAMYGDFASGFRLQDLTVTTDDAPAPAFNSIGGISTYGLHLDNCSNYEIIRTYIQTGAAGVGSDGTNGFNGSAGDVGIDGTAGNDDNETSEGNGGMGGAGGGCTTGIPGAAGAGCNTGGCCFSGCNGGDGSFGNFYWCGSGGGGGGGGGQEARNGGLGGAGGFVIGGSGFPPIGQNTSYSTSAPCRTTGAGNGQEDGCNSASLSLSSNQSGRCGADGVDGPDGSGATAGPAGTHGPLFFVPGGTGTLGTYGQGGQGGHGGGGGAGEGESGFEICVDGAGAGGGGGGGGGEGGGPGEGGYGGGSSYGIYLVNSATGIISQANVNAGAAGSGGSGGIGGIGGLGGNGGNGGPPTNDFEVGFGGNGGDGGQGGTGAAGGDGADGESIDIYGTAPSYVAFNFSIQPLIQAEDKSCTYTDVNFNSAVSGTWNFGANSAPISVTGTTVTTQFTDVDRQDVIYNGELYEGFFYVGFDGITPPEINTSANLVVGTVDSFYLCEGDLVNFFTTQIADTYHWDFNGAITNPAITETSVIGTFSTAGEYWVELYIRTLCCGDSPIDSVKLFVDPIMDYTINPSPIGICNLEVATLQLDQAFANVSIDSVSWIPMTNMNVIDVLTADVAPLVSTTYTATLYSATYSGEYVCSDEVEFVVNVSGIPEVINFIGDETCNDDGSSTIVVTTGQPTDYTYDWSHDVGETNYVLTGLASGFYTVTVTNIASGCFVLEEFEIGLDLFAPNVYFTDISNVNCPNDMDGAVTANLDNASNPTTYTWSNSATTPELIGLAPGIYTITVVSGAGGCITENEIQIFSPDPIILTGTVNDASCGNDGAVDLEFPTGGIPQYLYNWSNSTTDMSLSGVGAGTYTVTVTDENGCTSTESYTIGLNGTPPVEFIRE